MKIVGLLVAGFGMLNAVYITPKVLNSHGAEYVIYSSCYHVYIAGAALGLLLIASTPHRKR